MGVQIVLHRADEATTQNKDETRNLGLQSIVDREDTITAQLISDASKQATVAYEVTQTINKLNTIIANLTWAANTIYQVIEMAYMADVSKTQKFVDINTEAKRQI